MKIIKVLGTEKKYVLEDGTEIGFDEYRDYKSTTKIKPKKKKKTKKNKGEKNGF